MTAAKHTPGPWSVSTTYGSVGGIQHANGFIAFSAIPHTVCDSRRPGESWIDMRDRTEPEREAIELEQEANCRLIAAAPDLLTNLVDLLAMCKRQDDFNDDGDGRMFDRACEAIAKATGSAP